MRILSYLLVIFIPAYTFIVVPRLNRSIVDNLYDIRLYLLIALSLVGLLVYFSQISQGRSLFSSLLHEVKKSDWLSRCVFLYLLSINVSALLSPLSGYAFLGHPGSQFGTIMLILSYSAALVYYRFSERVLVLKTIMFTTIAMGILAVIEAIGFRPFVQWLHSPLAQYPLTTVGLRQHLAGWFSIVALLPIFFYRERAKDTLFWVAMVLGLLGIALTTSSAASIGVGVGLLIYMLWGIMSKYWKIPVLLLSLFLIFVSYAPNTSKSIAHFFRLNPPGFKDYNSDVTLKTRLYLWKSAFNLTLKRPIFGWGDETFPYYAFDGLTYAEGEDLIRKEKGFNSHYVIKHRGSSYIAYRDDFPPNTPGRDGQYGTLLYVRAHDLFFDELYAHGFLGFLIFLSLIFLYFKRLYVNYGKDFIFLLIVLLPYGIFLMAWFYIVPLAPIFMILLATVLPRKEKPHKLVSLEVNCET